MSTFRAAAVQMRSGTDIVRNVEALEKLVSDAVAQGAHYVQTPEMTGAMMRDRAVFAASLRDESNDLVFNAASALAKKHGIFLHIGSTAIDVGDGKIANRGSIFAPSGDKITTYDKVHMFDVDLDNGESWRESATYEPGKETVIAELPFANVGMAVCYDIRFPQLFRAQALAGANVITAPAAFTRQTGEAHWHVLQRARAIENGAFLISAAQGGLHEDGRETYGHSLIVSPWGKVLAEAAHDEPAVIVADIDIAESASARAKVPNLKNAREFSVKIASAKEKEDA
ncbi:carbon-nitrogen hydrolase family protein [Ochrobactrum quorumnocens]|jgi:predicted amidohydrolase|uniref:Carbon-nitrogen hydrolase family protein n=1 Tax=Ochrobactrum quorumnocens TaxID=271865 RepID=A0A248UMB9_9HYPH|nr:carbon-nitrogen hydrolase family protein [[Ochrobactrum] quorumnocens]ASV87541.1 carbon-nitrogen hydrolase family protein [[Ochrobactrum] quorumnocens]KAA9356119.1 carbon-nitrogen hydrolase family protein [[Ochrobactrum] quorumnocens]MBD7993381.1 carbon-nitrogen hydrolase family protein [Ochrobactrum gallinarum]